MVIEMLKYFQDNFTEFAESGVACLEGAQVSCSNRRKFKTTLFISLFLW